MRDQLIIALANHPLIGVRGLSSLLCFSKGEIIKEIKTMRQEGLIEMKGRYYRLRPMYKQLEMFNNN
jgi:predicted transcriptional regulator